METNHDIAPPSTFNKGKSWLTEPNPHPSTQVAMLVYILLAYFHIYTINYYCKHDLKLISFR